MPFFRAPWQTASVEAVRVLTTAKSLRGGGSEEARDWISEGRTCHKERVEIEIAGEMVRVSADIAEDDLRRVLRHDPVGRARAKITLVLLSPKCPELTRPKTSGNSCAITGSRTRFSNPKISSTTVATLGTGSSINHGS
jgi:hypothetical protein